MICNKGENLQKLTLYMKFANLYNKFDFEFTK